MAKISKEDIREYSTKELIEKIKDEKQNFKKLKFNHAVSPIDNPVILKSMRRNIASLLTELRARELQGTESAEEKIEEKQ